MNERLNVLYRIRVRVFRPLESRPARHPEDGGYHTKIKGLAERMHRCPVSAGSGPRIAVFFPFCRPGEGIIAPGGVSATVLAKHK